MFYPLLVSTAELERHLGHADWVVVDCRHDLLNRSAGAEAYAAGHIPGAHFLHCDTDLSSPPNGRNGRHPLPSIAQFAATLARCGVRPGVQLVAYDAAGGSYAARLWWMARWLGHEAAAILDGGWGKWVAEGRPQSTERPVVANGQVEAVPRLPTVDSEAVAANLHRGDFVVVDARANDRYRGQNETIDPVAGHIPGALNRFFRDNLAADGCFKTPHLLREEFAALLGRRGATEVVHQCGSGVTACHNLFAMELAGLTGSKLYPGSWSEWIADPTRPIATE
jgi:thiosulfate/3-mercaptopyruvate sulfurtransferase